MGGGHAGDRLRLKDGADRTSLGNLARAGVPGSCGVETDGLGLSEGVAKADLFRSIGYVDRTGDWGDAGTERDVGVEAGHY